MKVLVMAKAPVPGLAKTRLGAVVGHPAAAELAAAGLLDTVQACAETGFECVVALTGTMADAARNQEIQAMISRWTVVWQRGEGFAERLAHAHADAGSGPLIQVGMDTPQVTPGDLAAAAEGLAAHDTVLGPADDGGWWVLGRHDPTQAEALKGVPMSTPTTCEDTRAALIARGLSVGVVGVLRDVDTVTDADIVAAAAPHTRFARAWAMTKANS